MDLQELHLVAQLLDNLEILVNKMENCYNSNDSENFLYLKKEALETQNKVSRIVEK